MGILNGLFGKNDDQLAKYKNNLGETDEEMEEVGEPSSDVVKEPRNGIEGLGEKPKLFGDEGYTPEEKKEISSMQAVQPEEAVNEKPDRLFRIVIFIDGTYSFTTIFKKVYAFLNALTVELDSIKLKGNIGVKYEMVVHYEGEAEDLDIRKCEKKEGFINELNSIVFKGGADDGKDYMYSTIKRWGKIQKTDDEKTEDAIFYFTDSIVVKDSEDRNTGVKARFVRGYQYLDKDSIMPVFDIVDREGEVVPEINNGLKISPIKDLVEMNENNMREEIERIFGSLLNDMSANG